MLLPHLLPAFRAFTLAVSVACLSLASAHAATLLVVQDNQIQSGTTNAVTVQGTSGSATTWQLAARDTDFNRKVYLGLNLTGALQPNQEFANATLSLTSSALLGSAGAFTTVSFNVYGITGSTSWSESTITWNNAPYNSTSSAIALNSSGTVLLGSFSVTLSSVANTTHTFTGTSGALTTYLNWAAGRLGNHYGTGVTSLNTPSLVLTSTTGPNMNLPGVVFHSSEAATSAYLPSITFSAAAIPEPANVALLAAAATLGLTLAARRSRRTAS
ncbi:MAG: hypothetical protein K0R17_16 [Rariglobus sp.]|jgi:hypothetical protein|nr:hypothetical protein [Rariglobus sp.]